MSYGTPAAGDLEASALLGEWGQVYSWDETDLLQRTAPFHAALRDIIE